VQIKKATNQVLDSTGDKYAPKNLGSKWAHQDRPIKPGKTATGTETQQAHLYMVRGSLSNKKSDQRKSYLSNLTLRHVKILSSNKPDLLLSSGTSVLRWR